MLYSFASFFGLSGGFTMFSYPQQKFQPKNIQKNQGLRPTPRFGRPPQRFPVRGHAPAAGPPLRREAASAKGGDDGSDAAEGDVAKGGRVVSKVCLLEVWKLWGRGC